MSAGKGDTPRPYSRKAWDESPLWEKFGKKPKLDSFKGNADKPEKTKQGKLTSRGKVP